MNPMTRRALLRASALTPVAVAANGCSFLKSVANTDMTKVANDIGVISGAVTAVENGIKNLTTIPASVRDKVVGWIENARAVAATVTADISTFASQPLVIRIEDDVRAALEAGASLLPTNYTSLFNDALLVLSAVKNVIGLASMIPLAADPGAVDAARLRLMGAARRGV